MLVVVVINVDAYPMLAFSKIDASQTDNLLVCF